MDFLVAKNDLHECRLDDGPTPEPADGQALLEVDRFGLTANNITYAMFGEAMSYWEFFPAREPGAGVLEESSRRRGIRTSSGPTAG